MPNLEEKYIPLSTSEGDALSDWLENIANLAEAQRSHGPVPIWLRYLPQTARAWAESVRPRRVGK